MKDITVKPDITIRQAMKKIGKSGKRCLVIVDEKNTLLGTLSDGDLRKAILNGSKMNDSIQNIYQSKPTVFVEGKYELDEARTLFKKERFDLIPIVDEQGELIDILLWGKILNNSEKDQKEKLNVPVVIMAGGKGTRMEPFTKVLPKPLVPIHDKPIIEHIIERFIVIGCSDFHLTVNYKGKILKAYFEELQPQYNVSFVDETEPLGTAGSLRFLDGKFENPFFVTNCDIIIKADYTSLYEFHQKGKYDITLVASAKEYIIPYGTCELNGDGNLSHINEKPKYDFLINTGLYVLNPDVLRLIPKDKFYHITHLIEDANNNGKKVGVFPIDDDDWIDIGQWAEYKQAIDKF
ncbi:MAG: NTP transferase domain-containing protein [Candidatus Marinimicrobia bacterium]|jgi:dTDP-glucose pyrophosphorylase|nr:NTP transferase domain-containing protein [Candidatus Neomarinimicrobiota bacterium]MBT7901216.1 NTP transferase domain-containing protein [Candidatus Neomarinimicrobiota bacterium]